MPFVNLTCSSQGRSYATKFNKSVVYDSGEGLFFFTAQLTSPFQDYMSKTSNLQCSGLLPIKTHRNWLQVHQLTLPVHVHNKRCSPQSKRKVQNWNEVTECWSSSGHNNAACLKYFQLVDYWRLESEYWFVKFEWWYSQLEYRFPQFDNQFSLNNYWFCEGSNANCRAQRGQ